MQVAVGLFARLVVVRRAARGNVVVVRSLSAGPQVEFLQLSALELLLSRLQNTRLGHLMGLPGEAVLATSFEAFAE